jgi:hypothetical protein
MLSSFVVDKRTKLSRWRGNARVCVLFIMPKTKLNPFKRWEEFLN